MKFFRNPWETIDRCGLAYKKAWDDWQIDKKSPILKGDVTKKYVGPHPEPIQKIINYEYR